MQNRNKNLGRNNVRKAMLILANYFVIEWAEIPMNEGEHRAFAKELIHLSFVVKDSRELLRRIHNFLLDSEEEGVSSQRIGYYIAKRRKNGRWLK